MAKDGFVFPVVRLELDFKAPALHDDLLSVFTKPTRVGGSSITMNQKIMRKVDGKLLADGMVTLACISPSMKARRIPLGIRQMLEKELECGENEQD
jgi:acyl-CoA thioester hydrolase